MCDCNDNFIPLPQGKDGKDGKYGGFSARFLFDSATTTTAPNNGTLKINNNNPTLATQLVVHFTGADNTNQKELIIRTAAQEGSYLRIFKEYDPSIFLEFLVQKNSIVSITSTYIIYTISYITHNGVLNANDSVVYTFNNRGDKGDPAPPMLATTSFSFNQSTGNPGTSTYTFTLNPILTGFDIGNSVRLSDITNTNQYLEGIVTAYNTTTGSMTILLDNSPGGGWTANNFRVMITGRRGANGINGVDAYTPVGIIQDYVGTTPPTGYMSCHGQAISRTGYNDLFALIGTTFGVGDGSTTFNIPDLRRRVKIGYDPTSSTNLVASSPTDENYGLLNNKGGVAGIQLSQGNIPAHNHKVETVPGTEGGGISVTNLIGNGTPSAISASVNVTSGGGTDVPDTWSNPPISVSTTISGTTGNGTTSGLKTTPDAVENRVKYIVLAPIIKVV